MSNYLKIFLIFSLLLVGSIFLLKKNIKYFIDQINYKYFNNIDDIDKLIIKDLYDIDKIQKPYNNFPKIQMRRISEDIYDNPFSKYYEELQTYLNSEDIIEQSRKISYNFKNNCLKNKALCRENYLYLFGYNDNLKNKKITIELLEEERVGDYIYKKYKLFDDLGFYLPVLYLRKMDNTNVKGTVISIHGRSSSPEFVLGINKEDYTRKMGKVWVDSGYEVYAPLVQNGNGMDFRILGFSPQGYDLFQLNNLLKLLHNKDLEKIIVHGISYGALLAEALAIVDTDNKIHTTISSQSMFAIQDWMYFQNFNKNLKTAKLNGRGERGFDALPDIFNALYGGIINYSLIHPKKLILSLSSGSIKNNDYFNIETSNSYLKEIKKIYKEKNNSNNFAFNYFIGTHEADPNGVIKIFEEQFLD